MIITHKKETKRFSTEEIMNLFKVSDNLDAINEAVEKAQERLFVSWASVEIKDKSGELIPIKDIIKQQETLLKRHGPISDTHTNKIIGETLAYKVLEHPESKSKGVLHLNKIYDDNEMDNKVWDEIKSGVRTGSSVGGYSTDVSNGTDKVTGERVKVLQGFNQFETASVANPCNPLALNEGISAIAKSDDSLIQKNKEGLKMETDVSKDITELKDSVKAIAESVKAMTEGFTLLKKKMEDDEEDKKKAFPPKKDDDEEDKKKAFPPKKDDEEEPKDKKKAGDKIEGEGTAPQPEDGCPEVNNDKDVFKKIESHVNKKFEELTKTLQLVNKVSTPRPSSVAKSDISNLGMDLVTGKKRMTFQEVTKAMEAD